MAASGSRRRRRPTSWNNFCRSFANEWRNGNHRTGSAGDGDGAHRAPPLKMQQAASRLWQQLDHAQRQQYVRMRPAVGGGGQKKSVSTAPFRSRTRRLNVVLDMLRALNGRTGLPGDGLAQVTQLRRELIDWQDSVICEMVREMQGTRTAVR